MLWASLVFTVLSVEKGEEHSSIHRQAQYYSTRVIKLKIKCQTGDGAGWHADNKGVSVCTDYVALFDPS